MCSYIAEVAVEVPRTTGYYEIPRIPEILREFTGIVIAALEPHAP